MGPSSLSQYGPMGNYPGGDQLGPYATNNLQPYPDAARPPGAPPTGDARDPNLNYNKYGVAYGWNPPERQHPLQRLLGSPRAGSNIPMWKPLGGPQVGTNTPMFTGGTPLAGSNIPPMASDGMDATGNAGVGFYHGLGPGGAGSDYYGYPDFLTNAKTPFVPPPFQSGGQPYKML